MVICNSNTDTKRLSRLTEEGIDICTLLEYVRLVPNIDRLKCQFQWTGRLLRLLRGIIDGSKHLLSALDMHSPIGFFRLE